MCRTFCVFKCLFIGHTCSIAGPQLARTHCHWHVYWASELFFTSNQMAIHPNLWSVCCCCIPSGGPPALVLSQSVISYNFSFSSGGEVMLPEKQIDTQFSFSGFSSQKSQGRLLPQRRRKFWRYLMRSEQTHFCLNFWALPKRQPPSRAHKWLVNLVVFLFFVHFYSLVNPFNWKSRCLARSIHLISAD